MKDIYSLATVISLQCHDLVGINQIIEQSVYVYEKIRLVIKNDPRVNAFFQSDYANSHVPRYLTPGGPILLRQSLLLLSLDMILGPF